MKVRKISIDCQEIARELYISDEAVAKQLSKFARDGIVVQENQKHFKYQPVSTEIAKTLDELESLYSKRRVAITDMIYRQSDESMQSFSD